MYSLIHGCIYARLRIKAVWADFILDEDTIVQHLKVTPYLAHEVQSRVAQIIAAR